MLYLIDTETGTYFPLGAELVVADVPESEDFEEVSDSGIVQLAQEHKVTDLEGLMDLHYYFSGEDA